MYIKQSQLPISRPNINSKWSSFAPIFIPRKLKQTTPHDSFTPSQTPTQKQIKEPTRRLETVESLDIRGEKINSLPNLTKVTELHAPETLEEIKSLQTVGELNIKDTRIKSLPNLKEVKKLHAPETLEKINSLQTAGELNIKNTRIKSLPNLKDVTELHAPKTLEEMDALQTAGELNIGDTKIKSLPNLKDVKILYAPKTLGEMDALQTAGVLNIWNTKIKSLPNLTKVTEINTPKALGAGILTPGFPELVSIESKLFVENSTLSSKDLPNLIHIGDDNKIFYFKGNKNIETIDNLLQLVNKNRQEKGLLPLKALYIENDQYKIIDPEKNSTSNQIHNMQFKSSRYSDLQDKSIHYSYSDSGYDDLGLHSDKPNFFDLRDESIHYSYSDSELNKYNNQKKNINFIG